MSRTLFANVLIPVASEDDARASVQAVLPFLEPVQGKATLVYVVEKSGGAPDKASVEQREEYAMDMFDAAWEAAGDAPVEIGRKIVYGADIAETIIQTANDYESSAIVFTPRGGSKWMKLLTGDVSLSLINNSDLPVIVLSDSNQT